jgi:hypothetical protein
MVEIKRASGQEARLRDADDILFGEVRLKDVPL